MTSTTTSGVKNLYTGLYQVNGGTQRLHYIAGPEGMAALIVTYSNNSTRTVYYLQTDYQGSLVAVYNSNGTLNKQFSYDPWGRRRNAANWSDYTVSAETLFTRGYTGHEHLDDFGLINMNGRVYDPRLARFLSPDNGACPDEQREIGMQAPTNTQSYNRYSYCLNNPMKYTDPTGNLFRELFGPLGVVLWPFNATFNSITWLFDRKTSPYRNATNSTRELWAFGKSFDNFLAGKSDSGQKTGVTGDPNGTPYTYTFTDGSTYSGYYFDNYKDMVNFMANESEKLGVEISGYILVDDDGNYSYWVNDWTGNTCDNSANPYFVDPRHSDYVTFDNKRILGQVHTHPSCNYTANPNGYDGPSYKDYKFSKAIMAPVYSIGPTSVSMIYAPTSKYKTEADFLNLAKGSYNPQQIMPSSSVNPFVIMDRSGYLDNPFYYTDWGKIIKETW